VYIIFSRTKNDAFSEYTYTIQMDKYALVKEFTPYKYFVNKYGMEEKKKCLKENYKSHYHDGLNNRHLNVGHENVQKRGTFLILSIFLYIFTSKITLCHPKQYLMLINRTSPAVLV